MASEGGSQGAGGKKEWTVAPPGDVILLALLLGHGWSMLALLGVSWVRLKGMRYDGCDCHSRYCQMHSHSRMYILYLSCMHRTGDSNMNIFNYEVIIIIMETVTAHNDITKLMQIVQHDIQ